MTREEARKAAEVMLAYADGKEIEQKWDGQWVKNKKPKFNWGFDNYRIKPQPTYHPFKTAEECWNEMQKHQPFGWVKAAGINIIRNIASIENDGVAFHNIIGVLYNYKEMMKLFSFMDGAPFGIKENE